MVNAAHIKKAFAKAGAALDDNSGYLIELDQQLGDGDLGITARKISAALEIYLTQNDEEDDIGKLIMNAGLEINSAAPSTMGSLLAIALMRSGKIAKGQTEIDKQMLADMLKTAADSIQEKGKAKLGDKTVLDALIPASNAFSASIASGEGISQAGRKMLAAAEAGLESATPLRSQIGRASWVGDRTEGQIDPGCALIVCVMRALVK